MLRIVTYHRVAQPGDVPGLDPVLISATPGTFRRQMRHLRRWYCPVSAADVLAAFYAGQSLPARAVHVTFDDAYRDFAETAWPILQEEGIPATLFVPTAYPGNPGRSFWWDRLHRAAMRVRTQQSGRGSRSPIEALSAAGLLSAARRFIRELPHEDAEWFVDRVAGGLGDPPTSECPPLLDWDELRRLQREGVTLGAHTRHHVALSRVPEGRVRREIRASLEDLRREIGDTLAMIAYPYGMVDERVIRIARDEGCLLGFTCEHGLNPVHGGDPLMLRRTTITARTGSAGFPVRMLPWFASIDRWRHRHRVRAADARA